MTTQSLFRLDCWLSDWAWCQVAGLVCAGANTQPSAILSGEDESGEISCNVAERGHCPTPAASPPATSLTSLSGHQPGGVSVCTTQLPGPGIFSKTKHCGHQSSSSELHSAGIFLNFATSWKLRIAGSIILCPIKSYVGNRFTFWAIARLKSVMTAGSSQSGSTELGWPYVSQ